MCFLNFIDKCFFIQLIIHSITIVKVCSYKRLIICNKSLPWRFIGEVSEESNTFINLAEFLFYVSIVIEIFIKKRPNILLNGCLGDWYIIKIYGRMILFCTFHWKNYFCACFEVSGLKEIFYVSGQSVTLLSSFLSCDAELFLFWTTGKSDVSFAKSFTMDEVPSIKSYMQIRINSGPRIEPYGTPALIFSHSDLCPFRTTLWNLFDKVLKKF